MADQSRAVRMRAGALTRGVLRGTLRWSAVVAVQLALWQVIVTATGAPRYILPAPLAVLATLQARFGEVMGHLGVTALEIVLGLIIGTALGCATALIIAHTPRARRWLLPVLVASQAIPVFALAPLLTLWLGYGIASKVAMASLIIFFPVTAAFVDGLRRTPAGWLALARVMTAGAPKRARMATLLQVRLPAALPALASGLRVATAVAPIGAVVGEWVGSSAGLGYLMLHANGRMQTDLMFAALLTLAAFSIVLWFTVDALLRLALPWQPDAFSDSDQ